MTTAATTTQQKQKQKRKQSKSNNKRRNPMKKTNIFVSKHFINLHIIKYIIFKMIIIYIHWCINRIILIYLSRLFLKYQIVKSLKFIEYEQRYTDIFPKYSV